MASDTTRHLRDSDGDSARLEARACSTRSSISSGDAMCTRLSNRAAAAAAAAVTATAAGSRRNITNTMWQLYRTPFCLLLLLSAVVSIWMATVACVTVPSLHLTLAPHPSRL